MVMLCSIMQDTRRHGPGQAPVCRAAMPRSGAVWIAAGPGRLGPPAAGPAVKTAFTYNVWDSISAAGHPFCVSSEADAAREQPLKREVIVRLPPPPGPACLRATKPTKVQGLCCACAD